MGTQRINKRQILLITITSVTAAVFQPIFSDFLLWSGNAAWVPIIGAIVFAVVVFWMILALATRFPRQSLMEYLPEVWGPILGYPMGILFLLSFLLKGTFALRNVSEFFITAVLPETPISAVMFILLVLIAAGILAQLEGIVRFNELALPIIILGAVLVFIGTIPTLSAWNLLPLWNRGFGGMLHTFQIAASYLTSVTFILLVYPLIIDKDNLRREGIKTLTLAGLALLLIYLNIVLYMSSSLGQVFTWPYLTLTENIRLGLERGEALFMIVWLLAAFTKISLFIYLFALGIVQAVPKLKLWWVGLAVLPVIAYLAITPDNLPSARVQHSQVQQLALYVQTGVPLLTLLLSVLRKKRSVEHAS